jgi:dephospho-CoA kinase
MGAGERGAGVSARVVGLTGQIGAGKSMVAGTLRELGAKVLDADAIVHDEQSRGTVGYSAIVQTFGTGVLGEDKEIDRRKLANEVFSDPHKLARLERIMHPRVIARILQARKMLRDDDVMVVEAIKLLESDLRNVCDEIWIVVAPRAVLLERLRQRGLPAAEAELRLTRQSSEEEFRAAADVIIENDGDREATRARVREAWDRLRSTPRDRSR